MYNGTVPVRHSLCARVMAFLMIAIPAFVLIACGDSKPGAPATPTGDQSTNAASSSEPAGGDKNQPTLEKDGTISLPEPSQRALGIQTTSVQAKAFSGSRTISFQVFREADERPLAGLIYRSGFAYAMTLMDDNQQDLRTGQQTDVMNPASSVTTGAKVVEIDALPGSAHHQREVVLEIPDRSASLNLSQSVTVSVPSAPTPDALVVPQSAVLDSTNGTFAYVKTADGYKRVPIKTGLSADSEVQVLDGLKAGDVVVTSPVQTLWLTELKLQSGGGE